MHARVSGLCDYLARDEADALRIARGIVSHLHWPRAGPAPDADCEPPLYPAEELLGVAPVDVRVPFDVREILARVVDGSRFEEFKADYGVQLACGWAALGGYPLGVVANNGILFSEEAQKGAQFIELCNRSDTPILFVQNITGFMVGTSRVEVNGPEGQSSFMLRNDDDPDEKGGLAGSAGRHFPASSPASWSR